MYSVGSQLLAVDVPLFVIEKESACLTFNFHIIVNREVKRQRREITHNRSPDTQLRLPQDLCNLPSPLLSIYL